MIGRLSWATLSRVLRVIVALLILKVTFAIVLGYQDYFPPNFDSEFLLGRKAYFAGGYRVAFYAHILSGPMTLLLGLLLVSDRLRSRFPKLHRSLGKAQSLLVLLVLAPSGLWMAAYAGTFVAAAGFAVLAAATGLFVALGWRAAVQMRFESHRRWMWRCFLLLCSAVVLRLIGGLTSVSGIGGAWSYPTAAWVSWLLPLAAYEMYVHWAEIGSRDGLALVPAVVGQISVGGEQSEAEVQSRSASSLPAIEMSARR